MWDESGYNVQSSAQPLFLLGCRLFMWFAFQVESAPLSQTKYVFSHTYLRTLCGRSQTVLPCLVEKPLDRVRLPHRFHSRMISGSSTSRWPLAQGWPESQGTKILCTFAGHRAQLLQGRTWIGFGLHGTRATDEPQQSSGACIVLDVCAWCIPPKKSCRKSLSCP